MYPIPWSVELWNDLVNGRLGIWEYYCRYRELVYDSYNMTLFLNIVIVCKDEAHYELSFDKAFRQLSRSNHPNRINGPIVCSFSNGYNKKSYFSLENNSSSNECYLSLAPENFRQLMLVSYYRSWVLQRLESTNRDKLMFHGRDFGSSLGHKLLWNWNLCQSLSNPRR